MAWERIENSESPKWVRKAAVETRKENPNIVGKDKVVHGDSYVYKIEFRHGNHGHEYIYHRQLKSDYFETTPERGTCPNCQSYIRRYEEDDYLTCHRCGWQYKPLKERLKNILSVGK